MRLNVLHINHFNHILNQTNSSLSITGTPLEVEVNSSVTLRCPLENRNYITRLWYRGYFIPETVPATREQQLFSQISSVLNVFTTRADISVDPSSFAMTIGKVQLKDDGYFSCRILDRNKLQNIFKHSKVDIFSKSKLY